MRVRKQDANGDYTFGQGQANFFINSAEGVGQRIVTRLLLWEGEWFLDQTAGTPYTQEILGYGQTSLRDAAIKAVILGTPGVTSIESYNSVVNPANRSFTVQATVMTQFSTNPVNVGPVTL